MLFWIQSCFVVFAVLLQIELKYIMHFAMQQYCLNVITKIENSF